MINDETPYFLDQWWLTFCIRDMNVSLVFVWNILNIWQGKVLILYATNLEIKRWWIVGPNNQCAWKALFVCVVYTNNNYDSYNGSYNYYNIELTRHSPLARFSCVVLFIRYTSYFFWIFLYPRVYTCVEAWGNSGRQIQDNPGIFFLNKSWFESCQMHTGWLL